MSGLLTSFGDPQSTGSHVAEAHVLGRGTGTGSSGQADILGVLLGTQWSIRSLGNSDDVIKNVLLNTH